MTGLKFRRLGGTTGSSVEHFQWPPPAPKRPAYVHIAAMDSKMGAAKEKGERV